MTLSQEFSGKLLELVKQKGFYPYVYIDSFETFDEGLTEKEKKVPQLFN